MDPDASNATLRGKSPEAGSAVNSACGFWFAFVTVIVWVVASVAPSSSVTVNVAV